jgi:hypothetical protein
MWRTVSVSTDFDAEAEPMPWEKKTG